VVAGGQSTPNIIPHNPSNKGQVKTTRVEEEEKPLRGLKRGNEHSVSQGSISIDSKLSQPSTNASQPISYQEFSKIFDPKSVRRDPAVINSRGPRKSSYENNGINSSIDDQLVSIGSSHKHTSVSVNRVSSQH
jgi:hypothetical protein